MCTRIRRNRAHEYVCVIITKFKRIATYFIFRRHVTLERLLYYYYYYIIIFIIFIIIIIIIRLLLFLEGTTRHDI